MKYARVAMAMGIIVMFLAACGSAAAPGGGSSSTSVTISNFAFVPATLTVKVGTTVTWTNQDTVAHTVASDAGDWISSNLAQGQSYTHTFDTAGTFTYHCSIHPNMKGTIVVTQ